MNWKSPPPDNSKNWINKSLEMQVILACNWSCHACDELSNLHGLPFIKHGAMTVEQVAWFASEIRRARGYFGRLRIIGGEPTLHPKLTEIVSILGGLVPAHLFQVELVTNGSKPAIIAMHANRLKVRVSDEDEKQKYHEANLRATPATLGYRGIPCNSPWFSGMSLNRFGYFPCSAGASAARLRDWMRWQRLTLPLSRNYQWPGLPTAVRDEWPDLADLCTHCYRGLRQADKVHCGTGILEADRIKNAPHPEADTMLAEWSSGKPVTWAVYEG